MPEKERKFRFPRKKPVDFDELLSNANSLLLKLGANKVSPPISPEEPPTEEPLDINKLFPFARTPEFEVGPKDILPEGGLPWWKRKAPPPEEPPVFPQRGAGGEILSSEMFGHELTPSTLSPEEQFQKSFREGITGESATSIWVNTRTGENINQFEKDKRFPKGFEAELDEWVLNKEGRKGLGDAFKVFGEALTKVPRQTGAAILQATQGQGGASVVDRDWADRFIADAQTDLSKFVAEVGLKHGDSTSPIKLTDIAQLPQNIAFSLTSMGAGLGIGVPTALVPLPGARVAAYVAGSAASGAVAYSMTTYQIMQQYLEVKNAESMASTGRGITPQEEKRLKKEFESLARKHGLWEAVPEAISNLAFAKLLLTPLSKMIGRSTASAIVQKLVGLYGQEFLTETITQKGQVGIEVEAGLREEDVTWGEAFKEIAPQTFLLTTILAGAGQVSISSFNKIKSSLKKEMSEDHPRYNEILEQAKRWVEGTSAEAPMIPPSVQAVQAGRAELVPEQTVNEYAKTLIGQEFATSAVTDPAIARAKGLVDKLTSVTPKGVKFESGKFLTFEKFPPTAEYLAQQGIPTEVPPEAVSRPTEVVTPIAPEMTPEVQAVQAGRAELVNKLWYRGTTKSPIEGQDTFWTSDRSIAGDFGVARVGDKANIGKLESENFPTNVYNTTNKETIATELGIKIDPFRGSKGEFDKAVKDTLSPQGFDAVRYSSGTFEAEELHIFGKPTTPEVAQVGRAELGGEQANLINTAQKFPTAEAFIEAHGKDFTVNFPNQDKSLQAVDDFIRDKISKDPTIIKLSKERMKDVPTGVMSSGDPKLLGQQVERGEKLYRQFFDELKQQPTTPEVVPAVPPEAVPTEVVTTPERATQQVKDIQEQGRVAPRSIPPEDEKLSHTELASPGGPRPPKPPITVEGVKPERSPDDIIKEISDKTVKNERPDQAIMRLHEGARNDITRQTGIVTEEGDAKLKKLDIGVTKRGYLIPKEKDKPILLELYNALHNPSKVASGEIAVPIGYEEIYTELRSLADWDTASRLDFDPNAATLDDWFFRGWKPPEGLPSGVPGRAGLVTEPKALRTPRIDASFEEMIELGFEPLFWNPYQQWGYRHNLSEIYHEQMELVSHLKAMGDELIRPDAGGALPTGWRIPRIGPAFEGKPFAVNDAEGNPAVMFTRRWATPNAVANQLESIYGKKPDMGKLIIAGKTLNPLDIIDFVTFVPKRAKLFLSFFQQMDFLNRAGGGSWAGMLDSILAGKPIDAAIALARYPKTVADVVMANFSPTRRLSIAKQFDDTTPLIEGRSGVHLKGISAAGLSTMDFTIFAKDMDKLMRIVAEESGVWAKFKGVGSSLVDMESAMRRGLFGGVYPAAMITDIKNNIALMMSRANPSATDAQINAMIARETNKKYSTIPPSQSIIQNTFLREVLRRIAFSAGESEALLRQAAGAFHGPHKRFWIKQNLGIMLFVLAMANIIHWASTGEPLPKERYLPISKDNWGPLPFGYNTKFASPTLPFKGRGGSEITLDLMGQMDTAYRVLNPAFFVSARASVPVRATMNQVNGTDFYGAPIDDVGPGGIWSRATQLGLDLFSPIGAGGITTETLRQKIPGTEDVIPEGESRLGLLGLGLQATGINLRAEGTRELLDRAAKQGEFFKRDGSPVKNWSELEPHQKDEVLQNKALVAELLIRQETSVERGVPGSEGFAELEELTQQRIVQGEALVTEFENEDIDAKTFREQVSDLKLKIAERKSQVDEDFQLFEDTQELPEDPNKRALVEYYAMFDLAKRESGFIDWDKVDQLEPALRESWTPEQESFVDDNIGLTEWGPKLQEYIDAQDALEEYLSIPKGPRQANVRKVMRLNNPEIDEALVKWYGYKPIRGGVTPREPVGVTSGRSLIERIRDINK